MAAAKNSRDRSSTQERERARVYQARQKLFADQRARRVRDNWIAGIVAGVVVIGAVIGQFVYYGVGPGAPEPAPSTSTTPSPTPSGSSSSEPLPGPTDEP